jgi:small subunit ribosomal protein S1
MELCPEMSEQNPEIVAALPEENESQESFGEMLAGFDKTHPRKSDEGAGNKQIDATVVAVTAEQVFFDIGYKTEGVLAVTAFEAGKVPAVGDRMLVSSKGRNEEGYYDLSKIRVAQPKDWGSLEAAFEAKAVVAGTVTAVVKGGLTVDVGVRAFMPASRSGVRDAAEMEKLVGQEIRVRITKLDTEDEDVVVDRRGVLEEEEKSNKEARYAEVREGDVMNGTVRSVMSYGAFVDLGGLDGLLHIGEISWARVDKPEDVLTVGQEVQVKVVKFDSATKKIGLSMKQLLPHPWDSVAEKYAVGQRVTGLVSRLMDFGAFVELEPGVEGMIHVSEMSWVKKVRKPEDLLKVGETVDVLILGISLPEKRMALGLKQMLGDPWADAATKFAVGSQVEGPVMSLTKFGAFVQVAEGVEGMVHISEMVVDRRLNHPSDVLRVGEVVKAKVLEIDSTKRQLKLSMKQLIPTGLDEFLAEHTVGDSVTGRLVSVSGGNATVELGEGVIATCVLKEVVAPAEEVKASGALDLSSLSSMLNAKWKAGASPAAKPEGLKAGQVRGFKIAAMDAEAKRIELELA